MGLGKSSEGAGLEETKVRRHCGEGLPVNVRRCTAKKWLPVVYWFAGVFVKGYMIDCACRLVVLIQQHNKAQTDAQGSDSRYSNLLRMTAFDVSSISPAKNTSSRTAYTYCEAQNM